MNDIAGKIDSSLYLRKETLPKRIIKRRETTLLLFILLACLGLQIATRGIFLSSGNLLAMADSKIPEMMVTIGITFLLITGDFDLSVSSVMALSGMVCAWGISVGVPIALAMLLGVLAGAALGAINGLLVTQLGMASFIATLGTMYIGRSLTQVISQGSPISGMPQEFINFGTFRVGPMPWFFFLLVIIVVILQVILKKQKSMLKMFFVGSNEQAARMVGIRTNRIRMILFIVSALIASLSGLILTAKSRSASPINFQGLEMRFIAASVIGGASINGGQGSIVGSVLGYLVLVLIGNAMTQIGISTYWEGVIFGSVLLGAAVADAVMQRKNIS